MISRAETRYIRLSPRKFRQVIPLVKGKNAEEAIAILMSVKKKASIYAIELLKSAIANAKRVQGTDLSTLYISKMVANGGPMLKRFKAGSMGRASPRKKRTSHILVELDILKAEAASKPNQPVRSEAKARHAESSKGAQTITKEKTTKKRTASVKT